MNNERLTLSSVLLSIILSLSILWGVLYVDHNNKVTDERVTILEHRLDSIEQLYVDTFSVTVVTKDSTQIHIIK